MKIEQKKREIGKGGSRQMCNDNIIISGELNPPIFGNLKQAPLGATRPCASLFDIVVKGGNSTAVLLKSCCNPSRFSQTHVAWQGKRELR